MTSKQMIETLEFIRELTRYAPPGWEGHGYLETFTNLYGQKAAMMYRATAAARRSSRRAPKEMANAETFDVWVKPHGPSGRSRPRRWTRSRGCSFKGSRNPKEAIAFLKFFYQKENYLEYIQTVPIHFFPITRSLRADRTTRRRR